MLHSVYAMQSWLLKRKDETLHDVNIKQEPEGGLEKEDIGTGREGWSLLRRTDLHNEGM